MAHDLAVSMRWQSATVKLVRLTVQVFSLLGLFIADLCLNFSTISYPAYRIFSLLTYAVLWLVSSVGGGSSSVNHVSHIVGLVVGGCWGSLYLPSLPTELMELASPLIGALCMPSTL